MSMTVYVPVPEAGSTIDGLVEQEFHSKHALHGAGCQAGQVNERGRARGRAT